MDTPTPLQKLVETKLGVPLGDCLQRLRRDQYTYLQIGAYLREKTGEVVTTETVRRWCSQHEQTDGGNATTPDSAGPDSST